MEETVIDLRQIIGIFRRKFLFIIAAALICGIAVYGYTRYFITPRYTATASMYVFSDPDIQNNITQSQLSASKELVNTYIVVLKSETVLNQVINQLNIELNASDIRRNLTAGAIEQTEAFSVSYTDEDPVLAQRVVNTIVDVAPKEIIRVVKAGGAEVIDYAKEPQSPTSPSVMRNTVIGAFVGFVVSFGIFILIVLFDTKVRNEEDLLNSFDIPVIGIIPPLIDSESRANLGGKKT